MLITNDRNITIAFARQRVSAGEPMPGLIATTNEQSIGAAIEDILLIAEHMSAEEMGHQVVVFCPSGSSSGGKNFHGSPIALEFRMTPFCPGRDQRSRASLLT